MRKDKNMRKIVDGHSHLHGGYTGLETFYRDTEELMERTGCSQFVVASVPQWNPEYISQNPLTMLFKMRNPKKVFAYAGFDYYTPEGICPKDFTGQVKRYMEMGYDGIKMIEMKPMIHRDLGKSWISKPCYEEMFSYLEEKQIPLLMHVNDPETFWSADTCPDFALQKGWLYDDGTYAEKEEIYQDTHKVLAAHPRLQVVLPHFYFLSNDIGRSKEVMERFPNVRFDLTPGVEMYENFTKIPDQWHDFFIKYADRILFGTDNGGLSGDGMTPMKEKIEYAEQNVNNIRHFLETTDDFEGYGFPIKGIGLPDEVLEKIYHTNFEKMTGMEPADVQVDQVLEYTKELVELYRRGDRMKYHEISYPLLLEVYEGLKKYR